MYRTFFLSLILCLLSLTLLGAQNSPPLPSIAEIEKAVSVLAEAEKTSANEALLKSSTELLDALKARETLQAKASEYKATREGIGEELKSVTRETEKAYEPVLPKAEAELSALTEKLRDVEANRLAAANRLQDLTAESTRRTERRTQLPELIANARKELERVQALPAETSAEDPLLAERQKQLRQAQIQKQAIALQVLEEESSYINGASDLLNAQLALVELQEKRLTTENKAWQTAVANAGRENAQVIADQAKEDIAEAERHPYLRELAEDILLLAEQRLGPMGTPERRKQTAARELELEKQIQELQLQFADAKQQLKLISEADLDLGDTTGRLLLGLQRNLPDIRGLRAEMERTAKESALALLDVKSLDQRIRTEAGNLDTAVRAGLEIAQELQSIPENEEESFTSELREDLTTRRKLLQSLKDDKEGIRVVLGSTIVDLQDLITVVGDFQQFVDENIPWLRSQALWSVNSITDDFANLGLVTRAANIPTFLNKVSVSLFGNPIFWIGWLLIPLILFLKRAELKRQLAALAEIATLRSCSRFDVTLRALVITLLLSAPLAIFVLFPSWQILRKEETMLAATLFSLSGYVVYFSLLCQLLRRHGLAEAHFDFGGQKCAQLRKALTWFAPVYLIVLLLVKLFRFAPVDPLIDLDGRTFSMLQMVLLGCFLFHCCRILIAAHDGKFRRFAFMLGVLSIPIGLTVASWLGYEFAVVELERRLRITGWLLLFSLVAYLLVRRAILVARRRLRRAQIQAGRAARQAEAAGAELPPEETLDEHTFDATDAQRQSDRLIRAFLVVLFAAGLWSVWSDLLPALKVLDRVNIIPGSEAVQAAPPTGASAAEGLIPGIPSPAKEVASESPASARLGVSLADVLQALLAFFLTYVAVRNIPGLLEVAVLQNLKLQRGSSYAISSVVRYVIVIIGLMIGFSALSISWSKVQWLAAAVTVGIGFGLQEIFANFVAGLILLFERPMRVGDVVSVGTTSGKVNQIRMRATTITSFNNQELVVPNKSFITSEFINWTLTDSVLRAELMVGVAYGSDVRKVSAILERLGLESPLTLADPAPSVLFTAFGNSTLDFELRVYVNRVEDLVNAKSELHFAINQAFAEAGIEIAFPQLDVHLKPGSGIETSRELKVTR